MFPYNTAECLVFPIILVSLPYHIYLTIKLYKTKRSLYLKNFIIAYCLINTFRVVFYLVEYILQIPHFWDEIYKTNPDFNDFMWELFSYINMCNHIDIIGLVIVQFINAYQACAWIELIVEKTNKWLVRLMFVVMIVWAVLYSPLLASGYMYVELFSVFEEWSMYFYYIFLILSVLIPLKCYVDARTGVDLKNLSEGVQNSHKLMVTTIFFKTLISFYQPVLRLVLALPFRVVLPYFLAFYKSVPLAIALLTHWSLRKYFTKINPRSTLTNNASSSITGPNRSDNFSRTL